MENNQVTIATAALRALLSAAGAHFDLSVRARAAGLEKALTIEELVELQLAIEEAIHLLGFARTPALESVLAKQRQALKDLAS